MARISVLWPETKKQVFNFLQTISNERIKCRVHRRI